ncbi:uncharacterized protein LOC120349444 [Nilaparvata lugens]|uniref:uncharacterized protein LOC120349444 n=1 Tax=Nilaparvata lugens TaxID=108931 RepID=UPI00193E7ADC|nr:uncharacterized protein LOC120349444 [Nilaparvata lugens]
MWGCGSLFKLARSSDNFQRLLCWLGFKPNGERERQAYLYTGYLLAWLIDAVFGLLHEWENFMMRVSVLNDITLVISLLCYWNFMGDMHILFGVIKRYRNALHNNSSFENINRRYLESLEKIDDYMEIGVRFYVIFHFVFMSVPISAVAYKVVKSEQQIDYRRMPQLWYFHYPASLQRVTLFHYCCGNLLIYFALLAALIFSLVLLHAIYLSIYSLVSSFDYLILCMLEWDQMSTDIVTKLHNESMNPSTHKFYELRLRYGLCEIIVFHQNLCRETNNMNKGLQRILLIFINSCAIQMCLGFFSLTEGDDNILKYLTFSTCVLIFLTFICGFGQMIKNKVNILRVTLAQFEWVDKPEYYKKSLLVMITYAARDLEINPYGLYSLDMQTFTKSVLGYGLVFWADATKIDEVLIMQKRAIRVELIE